MLLKINYICKKITMSKVTKNKISDLIPDDKNFNVGNSFGDSLIEKSLRKFGAGRSILIDKNNKIIAGNKTVENSAAIGLEDVLIVESDGTKIIAVKRTDIDLNTKRGREMALADNASAKANITWDFENINLEFDTQECKDWGVIDFTEEYSDKNKEIDIDDFDNEMVIKLKYSEEDYHLVKEALLKIAATPEQAVYKLLKLKNE